MQLLRGVEATTVVVVLVDDVLEAGNECVKKKVSNVRVIATTRSNTLGRLRPGVNSPIAPQTRCDVTWLSQNKLRAGLSK